MLLSRVGGKLLRSLGNTLLGWKHGRVQPVVGLWISSVGRRKLAVRHGWILILGHEHVPHTVLGRNVIVQLLVEHDGSRVQMGIETLVLSGKVIILLFIHFLVDNILLRDAQSTTSSLLVNFRSSTRRFNARLQTTVTATRSSDISTTKSQQCGLSLPAKLKIRIKTN